MTKGAPGPEKLEGGVATLERPQPNTIDVNLAGGADSKLAVAMTAGAGANATLKDKFGTPEITGDDAQPLVAGKAPENTTVAASHTATQVRHVESTLGNDVYVSGTGTGDQAALLANQEVDKKV